MQNNLSYVLFWAAWQIGRPWDRERIQYQRWCAVCEGIERGLKFEEALEYAVKKLADEPSRGGIGVMKRDYLIEQGTQRPVAATTAITATLRLKNAAILP